MNIQDIIIRRRLFRKKEEELLPGLLFHSDDPTNTLTFINKTDGVTGASKAIDLRYSIDGGATWTSFPIAADTASITLPVQGTDIYLRGMNPNGLSNIYGEDVDWSRGLGSFHIRPTKPCSVIGNLQWIINCDDPRSITPPPADPVTLVGGSCCGLFLDATNIIDIDEFVVPYQQVSYMLCRAMFAGCNQIKRVKRTLFAFLNNPTCTTLASHSMALCFANCLSLDDCDLQFYNIKEIGSYTFSDAFGGCPFRTHLVYDAMKNIEKANKRAFSSLHGAGWVQGDPAKQILARGYDIPRVYGNTGSTIRSIADYTGFCAEICNQISQLRYFRNLNTYIESQTGYNTDLPFYNQTGNISNQNGVFVKYWADKWPQTTIMASYKQAGVPIGWKVVSCKPHYETTSGVDEYCIANSSTDTTWHEDKRCDEYGNLI